MINYLFRKRLRKFREEAGEITTGDLDQARKVLFALFARYGDVIISLSVIKEFIQKYPDKKYFVVTSHQMYPYARRLLGGQATVMSFNKRRNPIKLMEIVSFLKREKIDLGFNPWSSGDEAKFIISFARKFYFYHGFQGISNLYDRVRNYLLLPHAERVLPGWNPEGVERIVICPCSTNVAKSLDPEDLLKLWWQVRQRFPGAGVTIALPPKEAHLYKIPAEVFVFRKSQAASQAFLNLLEESQLVISVDAGPLHLADKLGLKTIGLFGPTSPLGVVDRVTQVVARRDPGLAGFFCGKKCQDPRCLHRLLEGDLLASQVTDYDEGRGEVWEPARCPLG
ncbi:MAG: glycosyltransferase family 9 protein [Thermodesulfobacteriota bacterium]